MVRKIAFMLPVQIKIPKEAEKELSLNIDSFEVSYRHPVLYVVRSTKRDKEYVYVYCGSVTYILMKVKPVNLPLFFDVLGRVLERYVDDGTFRALRGTMRIYGELSEVIDDIYYESIREAKRQYSEQKYLLLNFDPILRRGMRRALLRSIARVTLDALIFKYYFSLPSDIQSDLTFEYFRKIVLTEISIKNIMNALKTVN